MNVYSIRLKCLCLAVLGLFLFNSAFADTITFSIDADTFATTVNSLTSGGAAAADEYTVAIIFDITQINAVSQSLNVIGFCSEIAQPISPGVTYTLDIIPLAELASSTAGVAGSASAGMPAGGIGDLAAARISYLYDMYYKGTSVLDWTRTESVPDTIAFQLVQWEITHDSDLSLGTGSMWIDYAANSSLLNTNTLALAQSWLDDINTANVAIGYTSTNWDLIGVTSDDFQDVIIATEKNAVLVPEPSSLMLVALGLGVPLFRRRR